MIKLTEYLYAILKTGYGKLLLSSDIWVYYRHIEPEHIEGLKIPMFDENKNCDCQSDPTRYGVEDEIQTEIEQAEHLPYERMNVDLTRFSI